MLNFLQIIPILKHGAYRPILKGKYVISGDFIEDTIFFTVLLYYDSHRNIMGWMNDRPVPE